MSPRVDAPRPGAFGAALRVVVAGASLACSSGAAEAPEAARGEGPEAAARSHASPAAGQPLPDLAGRTSPASTTPAVPSSRLAEAPPSADLEMARARSDLSADEEVTLYPTWLAYEAGGQGRPRWRGRLAGWIYEPERDDKVRALALGELGELGELIAEDRESTERLVERMRPFVYDDERGERIPIALGTRIFDPPPSSKGGRFEVEVELEGRGDETPTRLRRAEAWVVGPARDQRRFAAPVYLLPPKGRLIISDIDDTVKRTHVRDVEAMLRATFLEPFRFVDGMAARYRDWLGPSGHLHFVSASPYQLYGPLAGALEAAGFPPASYTLREIRMDALDLARGLQSPGGFKGPAISDMLARLPGWTVILVGDSGERDPEVYGRVARRFPGRVERIFIRDVTGEPRDAARYAAAFEGVPETRWQLFGAADELPSAW